MLKVVIVAVSLLGATFGIPAIRNRIAGPLEPMLSKLGPVGEKIQAPARRWATRNEQMIIIRRLAEHKNQNKDLPSPLTFQNWIKQNFRSSEGQAGLDPWGRPYYLVHTRHQITVGSQGADRRRDTHDDIRTTVPLI